MKTVLKRMLPIALVLLLAALAAWRIPARSFRAYGVYRPAERTAGPEGFDTGQDVESRLYVFKPGCAYLFSPDSPAPPEVPVTTYKTDYPQESVSPSEPAENGLPAEKLKKYALDGVDALYQGEDGRLWIRIQSGLAEGGVRYAYRLEKLSDGALEERFGVDYETLFPEGAS